TDDGSTISGAMTATLSISNVIPASAGTYTVTVTNALGTTVSSNAILTALDPYISAQPAATQNIPLGSTANFTVAATGTASLTYQWFLNGNPVSNGPTGFGSSISG